MIAYPVAERFHAPQGEGVYTGVQMAFVRLVGCSVGQKVCTACDTDFDRMREDLGGGKYTPEEIVAWAAPCRHLCITGGEPLDRDIRPLLEEAGDAGLMCHVETSGTRHPDWLDPRPQKRQPGTHAVGFDLDDRISWRWRNVWVTVSPKPGYREEMVADVADEVKVIHGGLGDGPGWPTVADALRWAEAGKVVYLQPRNERNDVDRRNLDAVLATVALDPRLRLSVQLHKFIRTR